MNKEFLRRLQFFADLPEDDLDWLCEQVEEVELTAGEVLIEEGTPGDAAFIILDGELEVTKKSETENFHLAVREPGEVIGEMALLDNSPRTATVRAIGITHMAKISGVTFQRLLSHRPTTAISILHTVSKRLRQNEALLRQNDKMVALGTLAAGLAHELNNPAAAIARSVDQLRGALAEWTRASIELDHCALSNEQAELIPDLQAELEHGSTPDQPLNPLDQADCESEAQAWLEELGLEDAWEIAPTLISCGWKRDKLQELASKVPAESRLPVLKWLAAGCAVYSMLGEVSMSGERISEVVKSVKAYSYLDQGPIQEVDVREGLENTLVILRHKTKEGIKITKEYAEDLPHIEAYGSELNQVWTNIIDNAVDAMEGKGEITLRTSTKEEGIVVEIEDNGPGIPPDVQSRIFEPFFTTKPPGVGTGLGLHIAYTIINNHRGHIHVTSQPGKTLFEVYLPLLLPR